MRPGADYKAQQLKEIVGYLGEHFTEPLSLSAVAAEFGLSPQYFSTFFRDNFGRTFTQHINSLQRGHKVRHGAAHKFNGKDTQQKQDGPLCTGHPAVKIMQFCLEC